MPPQEYKLEKLDPMSGFLVSTHRGDFLVVAAKLPYLSTIIFQKHRTYNCWVYRRSIAGMIEPRTAVLGHILSTWEEVDVFGELEKRLAGREKAYWQLLAENMKLKKDLQRKARKPKKRG